LYEAGWAATELVLVFFVFATASFCKKQAMEGIGEGNGLPPFDDAMQRFFMASGERNFEQAFEDLSKMQGIVDVQQDESQRVIQIEILSECERRATDLADELVKQFWADGNDEAVDAVLSGAACCRVVSKAAATYCQSVVRQQIQRSNEVVKRLSSVRSLRSITGGQGVSQDDNQPHASAVTEILSLGSQHIQTVQRMSDFLKASTGSGEDATEAAKQNMTSNLDQWEMKNIVQKLDADCVTQTLRVLKVRKVSPLDSSPMDCSHHSPLIACAC
jgi:hypothetical protein